MNLKRRGHEIRHKVCHVQSIGWGWQTILFFKCKQVRQLWGELQMEPIRADMLSAESAKEVVEAILKLKEDLQCRVTTLLYIYGGPRGVVSANKLTPCTVDQIIC